MRLLLEHKCPKCEKDFKVEVTHSLTAEVTDYGYPYGVEKKIEVDWICPHCRMSGYEYIP